MLRNNPEERTASHNAQSANSDERRRERSFGVVACAPLPASYSVWRCRIGDYHSQGVWGGWRELSCVKRGTAAVMQLPKSRAHPPFFCSFPWFRLLLADRAGRNIGPAAAIIWLIRCKLYLKINILDKTVGTIAVVFSKNQTNTLPGS